MATGGGKRAASRHAIAHPPRSRRHLAGLAGGITLAVVAWGYLVVAAIDFGSAARGGREVAWLFLVLACVGAIAALFAGLVLVGRLVSALGVRTASRPGDEAAPRLPGGRRAAR